MKDRFSIEVVLSKNFKNKDQFGFSAGSIKERSDDINNFFEDKSIDAIWCLKGGDTCNELLNFLDYKIIIKNPKIFIGLSDISVLLNAIYKKTGLITFHGWDPFSSYKDWNMVSEYSLNEFSRILINAKIGKVPAIKERKNIRAGKAEGVLISGNIRCFLKLAGTEYIPDLENKILLLEGLHSDLKLVIYHIERLKQQHNFNKLRGIIVGQYYSFDHQDQFDELNNKVYFEDVLKIKTKEYNFPILKTYDFGHRCTNTFLPIGSKVKIDSSSKEIIILKQVLNR